MLGSAAHLQVVLILGTMFCVPFFWAVSRELTKLAIHKLFPPKAIVIKVKKLDGGIERISVEIDDSEALVNALLKCETYRF